MKPYEAGSPTGWHLLSSAGIQSNIFLDMKAEHYPKLYLMVFLRGAFAYSLRSQSILSSSWLKFETLPTLTTLCIYF